MMESNGNNFLTIKDLSGFSCYQGLNHTIYLYSPADQYITRQGFHVLKNPQARPQPYGSLYPQGPLMVRRSTSENPSFLCLPESAFASIETPEHHGASSLVDMVIVSRLYSGYVLGSLSRFHPDYVDRLFNVDKLYDRDPIHDPGARIIGTASLRKATAPMRPGIYVQRLSEFVPFAPESQVPSLAAMALSCQLYPNDPYAAQLAQIVSNRLQQRREQFQMQAAR